MKLDSNPDRFTSFFLEDEKIISSSEFRFRFGFLSFFQMENLERSELEIKETFYWFGAEIIE